MQIRGGRFREMRMIKNPKYRLVLQAILIGAFAGAVVSLYRLLLGKAETISRVLYDTVRGNLWQTVLIFAGLVLAGILVGILIRRQPMIKGSGIPQVEGQIQGMFHPCWWRVILAKMAGGTVSALAGLSLGREGPSIQVGASCGDGVSHLLKRDETEKKYLITCGASAGLAAAFNAPLAGMLFALEEVHKNFSVSVLLSALTSAITADVVSKLFFGMESVFGARELIPLPLPCYLLLPVLGAILGVCGKGYNETLLFTQKAYGKIRCKHREIVMIIPFVAAGIAGLLLPDILGGGGIVMQSLLDHKLAFGYVAVLLLAKFAFSMISFGSGAPGGIFFPLLVLGAMVGGLFGELATAWLGVGTQYYLNFLLLGMVGMFTAIVRAPITGIILIVEMSGSLTQMLALSVVAISAYVVADLLHTEPIYESLLKRMTPMQSEAATEEKVLLSFAVEAGSALDGSAIRDVSWPENCLVVSVKRGENEIVPRGKVVLQTGDYALIVCPAESEAEKRNILDGLFRQKA